jgi:hypothetical protein
MLLRAFSNRQLVLRGGVGAFVPDAHYGDGLSLYAYLKAMPITGYDPAGLTLAGLVSNAGSKTYQTYEAANAAHGVLDFAKDVAAVVAMRNMTLTAVIDLSVSAGSLGLDVLTGPGAKLMDQFGTSVRHLRELGERQRYLQGLMKRALAAGGKFHRHHMIPTQVLKELKAKYPEVYRYVKGVRGDKNIFELPVDVHKYLHKGSGGGWWNDMWMGVLGSIDKADPHHVEKAVEEFKAMRQIVIATLGVTP